MTLKGFNPDKLLIMCPRCKKKDALKASGWPGPCKKCKLSKEYQNEQKNKQRGSNNAKKGFHYNKFKEVTAFGYDQQTGKPVAITKKGKRIDPGDTLYDLKKDPHGWKATGQKK